MRTGKFIIGLGSLVSAAGKKIGGRVGAGILGFGLAHIVLGTLSSIRLPWR